MQINQNLGISEKNRPIQDSIYKNQPSLIFSSKHVGNDPLRKSDMSLLPNLRNIKVMLDGQPKFGIEKLTPEVIRKLYWEEKKSLVEIERTLGIPRETLRMKMIRYRIPRRSFSEALLLKHGLLPPSHETLFQLYWKERKHPYQIAKELGVSIATVRRWLKRLEIPRRSLSEVRRVYPRYPFSGEISEKSYLLGFAIGDLHVHKRFQTIDIATTTTHPAFIELFYSLFEKYGHCHKTSLKSKIAYQWHLHCGLDTSFDFLLKKKSIPIDTMSFYPFLAGYSDAEGYWKITKESRCDTIKLELKIASKDKEILELIKSGLEKRGFTPSLDAEKRTDHLGMLILRLSKKREVILLAKELLPYSKHKEKLMKIHLIVGLGKEKYWGRIKVKAKIIKSAIKKEVEDSKEQAKQEYEKNG